MQAAVITRSGPDPLTLQQIPTPATGPGQVLVQVCAASLNKLDSFVVRGPLFFLPALGKLVKPRFQVAGADFAGRVVAAGPGVVKFQPGDEVFGSAFEKDSMGAFAEYACVSEDNLAPKPVNLSFAQAAAVPVAAITALQGLRDHGQLRPGQRVLIDGASGGVGTFAVQIARALGAEVTAVCSPRNLEAARSLGADHLIDYTREDYTQSVQRYDLIFGANTHHSIFRVLRVLHANGTFVMVGGGMPFILLALLFAPLISRIGSKQARFFVAKMNSKDLVTLKELLEANRIVPCIEQTYPLSQVADALRYLETGHAKAKLVIAIDQDSSSLL